MYITSQVNAGFSMRRIMVQWGMRQLCQRIVSFPNFDSSTEEFDVEKSGLSSKGFMIYDMSIYFHIFPNISLYSKCVIVGIDFPL